MNVAHGYLTTNHMNELDQALADWAVARAAHLEALQALDDAATSLAKTIRNTYGA